MKLIDEIYESSGAVRVWHIDRPYRIIVSSDNIVWPDIFIYILQLKSVSSLSERKSPLMRPSQKTLTVTDLSAVTF